MAAYDLQTSTGARRGLSSLLIRFPVSTEGTEACFVVFHSCKALLVLFIFRFCSTVESTGPFRTFYIMALGFKVFESKSSPFNEKCTRGII